MHFPDWTHPNVTAYWSGLISAFHAQIGVDGLWTDMNEVSSFCDGRCRLDANQPIWSNMTFSCFCSAQFDTARFDDPPFVPRDMRTRVCRSVEGRVHGLDCGTVSAAIVHHNGVHEYDLHNLFGHMEALLTADALLAARGKRPFVLTRSTFAGSGARVAHWLGDNDSTWQSMRDSVRCLVAAPPAVFRSAARLCVVDRRGSHHGSPG